VFDQRKQNMTLISEPQVLLGGPAIKRFAEKLTGEPMTWRQFYGRVASGTIRTRKTNGHLTSTPAEIRTGLGCAAGPGAPAQDDAS
jgi:hypothetical protein